jgi:hypothetical protein
MRTLEEVKAERRECYESRLAIEKRLSELDVEEGSIHFSEKYPVGKRVMFKGQEYEISGYQGIWIYGRKIKKDGTVSKQEICLHGLDK